MVSVSCKHRGSAIVSWSLHWLSDVQHDTVLTQAFPLCDHRRRQDPMHVQLDGNTVAAQLHDRVHHLPALHLHVLFVAVVSPGNRRATGEPLIRAASSAISPDLPPTLR